MVKASFGRLITEEDKWHKSLTGDDDDAVPIHAMEGPGGTGGIPPTHS